MTYPVIPVGEGGSRRPELDAIRAMAAALVFAHHLGPVTINGYRVGLDEAVILFFVLSGYLLYRPFVRGPVNLRRYAINRTARIVPAYLAALVGIGILVSLTPSLGELMLLDVRLIQVAWTLQLEVAFYIALPILARLLAGQPFRIILLAGASLMLTVALLIALLTLRLTPDAGYLRTFPSMLFAFTPGMLVAVAESRGWLKGFRRWWPVGAAVLAAGLIANVLTMLDVVTAAGAGILVASAVDSRPWPVWAIRIAGAGAAISYSVYLWHLPMIERFGLWAVPLTLGVASVVYLLVERPVIRFARSPRHRQPESPPNVLQDAA